MIELLIYQKHGQTSAQSLFFTYLLFELRYCREREIRAAEERLLEKDIPRTADEFEKLVRSSPNSSFIWIKYMAFVLSLADIEKAREIAERYSLT